MSKLRRIALTALCCCAVVGMTACNTDSETKGGDGGKAAQANEKSGQTAKGTKQDKNNGAIKGDNEDKANEGKQQEASGRGGKSADYLAETIDKDGVVTNPDDLLVVMNKKRSLPADYEPKDLVVPNVRFPFEEDLPQKKMRAEAAKALEKLFAAAEKDGIALFAVSGYRSYEYQESIFAFNVEQKGEEEANRVSARPGQSEHQTGLTMDVSSESAGFDLIEAFGETPEGKWIAENAADFGFILRYPKGKEDITGYVYEPWHLRYVGNKEVAKEVMSEGLTLEEYFSGE
ncbi:M15 family metallopeptidase [Numidum massiliense]|uniref:M15 family metallopeptidase n=1 Tax=Numidum massiliense TaxID=1522315 RepID=UPI0006D582EF|nr:M15 family metallopeptidase [Numidum massiliense]